MYTVRTSKFHGSKVLSQHKTLSGAIRALWKNQEKECTCGGPVIEGVKRDFASDISYETHYNGLPIKEAVEKVIETAEKYKDTPNNEYKK